MTNKPEGSAADCSDPRYRDFMGFCTIAGMGYPLCHREDRNGQPKCKMGAPDVAGTFEKARQHRIRQIAQCVKQGKKPPTY